MRKYYPGITLFKLIGAVMVLSSHVSTPDFYKNLANSITGLEQFFDIIVPCFYMVAGFLACKGWLHAKSASQYIKKYLTWIIGIYLAITLACLFAALIPKLMRFGLTEKVFISTVKRLLLDLFLRGPITALWFIPPLIAGITVSYFFERKNRLLIPGIIAIAGFIAAQTYDGTLRSLIEAAFGEVSMFHVRHVFIYAKVLRIYFGMGLTFTLAGVVLAKNEDWFTRLNGYRLAIAVLTFTVAEILCLYYVVGGHFKYRLVLSMAPLSLWLFYGLLKAKNNKVKAYHAGLNIVSIVTYFSHGAFIRLNTYLFGWNLALLTTSQSLICIGLTVAECLVVTALILSIKKKKTVTEFKTTEPGSLNLEWTPNAYPEAEGTAQNKG